MAHITVNEFDWAGISTLPNAFLSLYFLWFAYQHCRRKHKQGSPTLNNLFVDGIFYLLGVTLADIAICILVVIGLTLGRSWTVLFSINWMIASTLIVEQLRWAKDNSRQPSRLLLPQWLK
ncbi:hypothetical protein BDF19DRAFT_411374 [Syncephalis fuscata]|nr:hypothetical protein BDF19DRAFT_411374 [Syncephalis fuscata]